MLNKKDEDIVQQSLADAKERLIALCQEIIADDLVEQHEAEELNQLLTAHASLLEEFPGNVIAARLANQLSDNELDQREAGNLLRLLQRVVELEGKNTPAAKPGKPLYDSPLPDLSFQGQYFLVIGNCATGKPQLLEAYAKNKGGSIVSKIDDTTPTTIVVGYFLGKQWQHGQCEPAEKERLLQAGQARTEGKPVTIIPEEHFIAQLKKPQST